MRISALPTAMTQSGKGTDGGLGLKTDAYIGVKIVGRVKGSRGRCVPVDGSPRLKKRRAKLLFPGKSPIFVGGGNGAGWPS